MLSFQGRNRLYLAACFAAVAFLAFVAGALTVQLRIGPYSALRRTLLAVEALHKDWNHPGEFGWYFYGRARSAETGVRTHDPDRAFAGYTLFTSAHDHAAFLIDMQGQMVHRWRVPFAVAWPDPKHLPEPPAEQFVSLRAAHLFPNGDLIGLYEQGGTTPWGCGLVKMDRQSRLLWTYDARTHHELAVADDGTIFTLVHEIYPGRPAGLPTRILGPIVEDYVVALSPEGRELQRVGITEALRDSPFASVLELPRPTDRGDLWHANDVEPLPRTMADAFPFLRPGQLLVSLRAVDTLIVIDLDERSVVWAARGPWHRQHDPDFLPNGQLLVFDNLGNLGDGEPSRVIEMDPRTSGITWQYAGSPDAPFFSRGAGTQQRLPNGNTLITESLAGRIFEITPDGTVVWEYLSPFRAPHDPLLVGIVHRAIRLPTEDIRFDLSQEATR